DDHRILHPVAPRHSFPLYPSPVTCTRTFTFTYTFTFTFTYTFTPTSPLPPPDRPLQLLELLLQRPPRLLRDLLDQRPHRDRRPLDGRERRLDLALRPRLDRRRVALAEDPALDELPLHDADRVAVAPRRDLALVAVARRVVRRRVAEDAVREALDERRAAARA